ncbi:MAG: hypothetical protein U0U46_16250 [Saprospiraceae bacterium]
MTCIVGIVEKQKVFIGGDSAGISGQNVWIRQDRKVFKVGPFVIGCTASFRMTQLLQFSFTPPAPVPDADLFKFMCTDFVDALRACFKSGGFLTVSSSVESGGNFLIGYENRLFEICTDFQVSESVEGFDSVGSGFAFALGALHALDKSLPAPARIQTALEIAAHRSTGVRPPFHILST